MSFPKWWQPVMIRTGLPNLTWTEFKQDCLDDSSGEMLGVDQTLYTTAPKNPRVKRWTWNKYILAVGLMSSRGVDPVPDVGFHSGLMNEVGRQKLDVGQKRQWWGTICKWLNIRKEKLNKCCYDTHICMNKLANDMLAFWALFRQSIQVTDGKMEIRFPVFDSARLLWASLSREGAVKLSYSKQASLLVDLSSGERWRYPFQYWTWMLTTWVAKYQTA